MARCHRVRVHSLRCMVGDVCARTRTGHFVLQASLIGNGVCITVAQLTPVTCGSLEGMQEANVLQHGHPFSWVMCGCRSACLRVHVCACACAFACACACVCIVRVCACIWGAMYACCLPLLGNLEMLLTLQAFSSALQDSSAWESVCKRQQVW